MIEPTEQDIGRKVVYGSGRFAPLEEGVITSITEGYVFVRYGRNTTSAATLRGDLEWAMPASLAALEVTRAALQKAKGDRPSR